MKESLNWRRQVDDNPLVAVGAAFIGGMVLGGVLGGGDDHQQKPSQPPQWQSTGAGAGLGGAIRKAAKNSGLEESFNDMTSNLFGTISESMKKMSSELFPSSGGTSERNSSQVTADSSRPAGASFAG